MAMEGFIGMAINIAIEFLMNSISVKFQTDFAFFTSAIILHALIQAIFSLERTPKIWLIALEKDDLQKVKESLRSWKQNPLIKNTILEMQISIKLRENMESIISVSIRLLVGFDLLNLTYGNHLSFK